MAVDRVCGHAAGVTNACRLWHRVSMDDELTGNLLSRAASTGVESWSGTPLGDPSGWTPALRTLAELVFAARQPMFLTWGTDLTLLYNEHYAEILGRKHPGAMGQPFLDVWSEIRDDLQEIVDQALAGGSVYMDDICLVVERHGFPEEAHFVFSYTPVRDGGRIAGFLCVCSETTSKVSAERRLRDSEAQFRGLAQAVPNHAWTAWPNGRLDWFNQQVFAYSGLSKDRLEGQGWREIVHPEDLADAGAAWARALDTGMPYEVEFRIRRADGAYRWHLVRAQPIRAADGGVIQWAGTNTDIEDRRAATEALATLNAELEERVAERTAERDRVWSNSQDLLAVVGADGIIRTANPAWASILGHQPEAVAGRSCFDFIWPDDAGPAQGALQAASTDRDLTGFENRHCHRDGTPRWISWNTSRVGDLIYAYGRDVTAEKEQASALKSAEEALRQSQKMEAVGQLTGGLAHDFNNLLTGITGSLELLRNRLAQGRTDELGRFVEAAQDAARRAAALTHRLLAFSRRQTLDPRPTDTNRLVAGMDDLIRRTTGPGIAVETVGAGGLWTVLVDPNQLENALLNLCINARDAMPDGGRLTIETANRWLDARSAADRELAPGQYVSLCVSDTGSGMSAEVIRRAFDPFFTTKPIGQGTGLGLSMIYGFVRQSGGQARIYSEAGSGTMVCLYLPRHLDQAGQAAARQEGARAVPVPRAEQGETVLIVDDEPTVRMLVTEVLSDLGYVALEAVDGPSGLQVLQSDMRIDLLITDVGLPGGMNGRQMADAARVVRPELNVLFITGYAENAVVGHGHLEPGMHILTKPFAIEALAMRIRDLMAGS